MVTQSATAKATRYIDADGHLRDTELRYRRYIGEPYNQRKRLSMGSGGSSFDNTLGGSLGTEEVDAPIWLDALERGGLDLTVLYPTSGLGLGFVSERDFALAMSRAYNAYVSNEYLKVSPRFQAVALLAPQDPKAAAAELRRAVEDLGMVGGMLPADGPYLLGKPDFDPIYEEAQRLGCMVAIHGLGRPWDGVDRFLFDTFIQAHTLGHPLSQMRHFTSIMFEGVLEKFPNLRLAFLEGGCTWVPFLLDRMHEHYELRGKAEAPLLIKSPIEYLHAGNVYFSCEAEETLLPETLRVIGDDVILYASDFPHWDADYPGNLQHLLGRADLTQEQRAKITARNAEALYRLRA
jgi:predicted TIM-barrel fold metal-dependent hydrolase